MFKSIRSRLAFSFAAIALVTAMVLGAVLLAILQSYYTQRELDYLNGNAKSIGATLSVVVGNDLPAEAVQLQVENLAFLSQTRVRVYDASGQAVRYDSGIPKSVNISLGVSKQLMLFSKDGQDLPRNDFFRILTLEKEITRTFELPMEPPSQASPDLPPRNDLFVVIQRALPVAGSPFGFDLNAGTGTSSARSSQNVRRPLSFNDKLLGYVELSDGPAYGRDVVTSVALGWAAASAVALLLAAAVGWYISRRIGAPVLALTAATTRMAAGDLASRAVLTNRDEFGQLAHSFNQMADQVETTVVALRRFVSDAAHELQTPLTALRSNLDLAADESDPTAQRAFIERAQATVKQLEVLTNDLLDLSRIQATTEHKDAVVDLAELLRERKEAYASQAEQASLALEMHLPETTLPETTTQICADATHVLRAVDNLVDNAYKFTPAGGSVTISLARVDKHVRLRVEDTGIGIPEGDLPQLFQRFHRGRNATGYPGSGLGLAIVKALVEQQGGQVTAENTSVGARFSLQWPAVAT